MSRSHKQWPDTMRIGSRTVGAEVPVYVIAEAGVNHNGDLATALAMVQAADAAGADAVKFQAFSAERLVTRDAGAAGYQRATTQREVLAGLELHPEDFAAIASQCLATGIELLVTPFGTEDVAMLVDLGVDTLKIASPDVTHLPLLSGIGRTGLPVIVSTGAASLSEIDKALEVLATAGTPEAALLHCVSSYPTPLREANLRCIGSLARRYGVPVGYSDHTTELATGDLAVRAGACILEKHFTLDPNMPGPDHAMSLRPVELTAYIVRARKATAGVIDPSALEDWERDAMGDGIKAPREIEGDVRHVARSSVTALVAISVGTKIERDMLTVKRPGGGIPPGEIDNVAGRTAAAAIPADTTITPDMLE